MKNQIRPELRPYIVPVGGLFLVLVLFALSGIFILGRVSSLRRDIDVAKRDIVALEERAAVLENLSQDPDFQDLTSISQLAVPQTNPSLLAAAQIKRLAAQTGATVKEMSISSPTNREDSPLQSLPISVNLSGTYDQLVGFTQLLAQSLPIMNISNVSFSSNAGVVDGTVELLAFQAALPERLPGITEPINSLTSSESETLSQINSFTVPILNPLPPPQSASPRANPFTIEAPAREAQEFEPSPTGTNSSSEETELTIDEESEPIIEETQ